MIKYIRNSIILIIRLLLKSTGGVLLSKKATENKIAQINKAVLELVAIENTQLVPGLKGIVVSKDRALQLYSLLFSYYELVSNPVALTVVFTATTDDHFNAYKEVKEEISKLMPDITFIKDEGDFKATVVKVLDDIKVKNIFFLVDDIVFIRKVDLSFASNLDVDSYILSLRHSPSLNRSYTANKNQLPPSLSEFNNEKGIFKFDWYEVGYEWSDPWSLDGHILSKAEVHVIARVSNFLAPNSFEAILKEFGSLRESRRGLCYFESKILNLPLNRVQNEAENICGAISADYLLSQWKEGMMLDTFKLLNHIPQATHEDHVVNFKLRPIELKINKLKDTKVTL
ncbi:MAG: hypothetical protein COA79_11385 [Planctomycetota bacterium]|nr:MAG: hypothetical protein COA79_11385 [Planctomycetota bacterium]